MDILQKLDWSFIAAQRTAIGYALWYGVMAFSLWLLLYVLLRNLLAERRISQKAPTRSQISREILYSLRSIAIFGIVTLFVVFAAISGWTRLEHTTMVGHGLSPAWPS